MKKRIIYTMTIDGVVHLLERVPIEELPEWKLEHGVRTVGPIGGPNTWPPALLFGPDDGIELKIY